MKRQLHFNVFVMNRGHHESAWRHPEAEKMPSTDFGVYQWIAKTAEKGLLDSIFIADALSLTPDIALQSINWCEPLTTLGALSVTTENIGLIATASTTYSEPYNLARQFSSVDRMSGGRVGCLVEAGDTLDFPSDGRRFLGRRPNEVTAATVAI